MPVFEFFFPTLVPSLLFIQTFVEPKSCSRFSLPLGRSRRCCLVMFLWCCFVMRFFDVFSFPSHMMLTAIRLWTQADAPFVCWLFLFVWRRLCLANVTMSHAAARMQWISLGGQIFSICLSENYWFSFLIFLYCLFCCQIFFSPAFIVLVLFCFTLHSFHSTVMIRTFCVFECCAARRRATVFLFCLFFVIFHFKLCYNRSSDTPHVLERYVLPAWSVGDIVQLMFKWVDLCVFSLPIYVCWDLDFWWTLFFNTDFQPPKLWLVFSHTFVLYHRAACLSASTGSFFFSAKGASPQLRLNTSTVTCKDVAHMGWWM